MFNRTAPGREKGIHRLERDSAFTNYAKEQGAAHLLALDKHRAVARAARFAWQYFFAAL